MKNNIKIATVYISRPIKEFKAVTMDTVRWLKISEALAQKGYQVDMITNEKSQKIIEMAPNLRRVPYSKVKWGDYEVIKTLFHEGFRSLERAGGLNHPFIICKTPVIAKTEQELNLWPWTWWHLRWIQKKINQKARYITVLNRENKRLWQEQYGIKNNILVVPTGVDRKIPLPDKNPYRKFKQKIALYIGNLCGLDIRKGNLVRQRKLNNLGKLLKKRNIRLYLIGPGLIDKIDKDNVTCFGPIENNNIWDYQYFANCGIVFADAKVMHNEASKIYYYLRTGLPVVSESPVPNNNIIKKADLGFIAPFNDDQKMADLIEKAIYHKWNKKKAIDYILRNHTWDKRVEIYDKIIQKEFSSSS
jgi:glycosyltransferase involved in cell wall biosynthesis